MSSAQLNLAVRIIALMALIIASTLMPQVSNAETVTTTLGTGTNTKTVAVNPITNKTYVANANSSNVTIIDGATNSTYTIATGTTPYAIAVNTVTNKVYVANYGGTTVTVIDGATNSTSTVTVGSNPDAVAVNPVTNKIYVTNFSSNNVTVIDGANNSTTNVTSGTRPVAVAVNSVTNKAYVVNYGSANATVIDGGNNSTTVSTGPSPIAVAVNPVTNKTYVANWASTTITAIDGVTNNITTLVTGASPRDIAVNPVTNKIYVANQGGYSVTVINGANFSATTVPVGTVPVAVALNSITNRVYVVNEGNSSVTVIDSNNNTTTLTTGSGPLAVAVNPVTNRVYVANRISNNVTVIDGSTNDTTTVSTGSGPSDVAVNPVTNKVYVTNSSDNSITVVNGANNSTTTVAVGTTPIAVTVNPVTNKIYVLNRNSANVTVINGITNSTTTVAAGTGPSAVALNPVTNKIYVVNTGSNNVTIIDGATNNTTTVPAGSEPRAIAVNTANNKVYVTNESSNSVTVIDGATNSTSTIAAGSGPYAVAVNPLTNNVYVVNAYSSNVTVIDGVTNNTITLTVAGSNAITINSITNKIYVANFGSDYITIIDGATNSTTTVATGTGPSAVAVNPITNKIYVTNYTSNNITVIDGITNSTATVAAGTVPYAIAVNPLTNKVYAANQGSNNITVLTEQQTQANPLTTAILPLAGNTTISSTPSFTLTPTNGFTPNPTGALTVYYQLDTWQGPWLTTQSTPPLTPGLHILYAFAADAQASTSTNTGSQSSPLIGTMAAYQFLVTTNIPPVITEGISMMVSMSMDSTPTSFNLTLHATDADNDPLTWSVIGGASNGTAAVNGTGTSMVIAYNPSPGYVGLDNFIIKVADNKDGSASITVNVTVNQTITINFASSGNGSLTNSNSQTVNYGTSATPVSANPDTGYHFVNWTGTGVFVTTTDNPLTLTNITVPQTITANFAINTYALSTTTTGNGGGKVTSDLGGIDCGPTCSGIYNYGTSVTLTAAPDVTSDFTGWSGGGCTGSGICQVTMDAAKNVTATFTQAFKTLSVVTSGYGSVASSPNGIDCGPTCSSLYFINTSVSLTSIPSSGYHLTDWGGDCTGSSTCIVSMSSDRNVTANFAINTYNITASPGINGSLDAATPSPATVNHGSTASFRFNAGSGYYVSNVSGCSGSAYTNSDQGISSYTYTSGAITGICSVSAAFTQKSTTSPTFSSASYFGGTGDEHGTGIAITNGALFTVGYGINGGILAHHALPPDSSPAWSVVWPNIGANDNFNGVAVTSTNIYTAGSNYSRTSDSGGDKEQKGLVAKFPLTGATGTGYGGSVWDVQTPAAPGAFPYSGYEGLNAILNTVEASNDFIYATGLAQIDGSSGRLFLSKLNAAGTILWTVNDSSEMLGSGYNRGLGLAALNNYIYAAGSSHDSGTDQPYLRKYDQSGTLVWTRKSALSGSYQGVTAFGGAIYAVGQTGALDFLIEKWDEAGNILWTKQYDRNAAEDILNGVTGLGSSIYAAGTTKAATAGGSDAALLQIDPATGNLLSTTLWGGSQDDAATGIATDGQDLYLIGNTASYGAGGIDMVLLRYTVPKAVLTSTKTGSGSGAITSSPTGIDCGTTCSGSFPVGSQVTLTATADPGSTFSGWSDEGCSGTGTCIVTMDTANSVTATFIQNTQLLTLNRSGNGTGSVTATPAGASGTPHNGTLINSPTWTAGQFGNGLSLTNGKYVSIPAPSPDIFNITGDLTITTWINPNSVTCSGADPAYALLSKRSTNRSTPYELFIGCGGTLTLHFHATTIPYPNFSSTGTITTGNWQHVVATRSFSGANATVTFYINGVESGSSTQNTGGAKGSPDPVWISRDGYHTGYTSQGSYSGLMDEVQIYNRAVSALEVARIYTNNSEALPNRVGNWKFDEFSGTTAADTVLLNCSGACSDIYQQSAVVALTATPSAGSNFAGWNGNADCSDNSVTMNADKSCTAIFNPVTQLLTASKTGTGTGTITSLPEGIDCGPTCSSNFPYGSAVVLFQAPDNNSGFSGWGEMCSGSGDCAFSMSSDRSVSSEFTQSPLVKNQRTGVAYSQLQTAFSEASEGDTIRALSTLPAASLIVDIGINLYFEGGYDTDYASCIGLTSVLGRLNIKTGTIRVKGLAIRP